MASVFLPMCQSQIVSVLTYASADHCQSQTKSALCAKVDLHRLTAN